jgi:uncharacterized protein YdbL (DUF1318 family)
MAKSMGTSRITFIYSNDNELTPHVHQITIKRKTKRKRVPNATETSTVDLVKNVFNKILLRCYRGYFLKVVYETMFLRLVFFHR